MQELRKEGLLFERFLTSAEITIPEMMYLISCIHNLTLNQDKAIVLRQQYLGVFNEIHNERSN